jgi:hypothetical protein
LPLFHFVSRLLIDKLSLTRDHFAIVHIAFYLLLAAGNSGIGALSNCLAVFVAIPAFRNCCGRNFCVFKSIDHAAGKSDSAIVNVLTIEFRLDEIISFVTEHGNF